MISPYFIQKAILLSTICLLAGCSLGSEPPLVTEIEAQPGTVIPTGESASLTISASGTGLEFEWTAQRGRLSDYALSAVIYTAPDTPGPDIVMVKITNRGGEIIRRITFDVIERPTPTVTNIATLEATPKPTQTPTLAPLPVACNHPAVTMDIFPQLAEENGQFSFYGPVTEPEFSCEAVYDLVRSGPIAIHIKYENAGNNYGFWGFATPNGYDTSKHRQLCFWAYAKQPSQSFRVKMKDTTRQESGVITTIDIANRWKEICTDISAFAEQGIHVDKMENVNLGFEKPTGSAEVWVADFEFR
jgi:hypothetical protein